MFNRSPRVEVRYPGTELPASGSADRGGAAAVPVADDRRAGACSGSRSFAFTGRPYSLLIVALAPLMMLGNFIGAAHAAGQEAAPRDRDVRDAGRGPRGPPRSARRSSSATAGTPRRPPWRRCTSRRCGWVRCCGPAGPSTGTSSRCGSASAGREVATRSRSRQTSAASPATPGRSTGSARATSRSTTCRSSSCCPARARSASPDRATSPPTCCGASACSSSGCTRRTRSSPPRSSTPPGRRSSSG